MTKPNSEVSSAKRTIVWLFALAIVALYLFGLTIPLLGPDEPRYAQVAREMFDRGDWITPTLGGFNWFEKPALLYWLQIASYNTFGVSEFAARFGSAIFGLGTIASLWILGRSIDEPGRRPLISFGEWLALISATSIGLIVFSRGASFDIILTFPMTASLVAFFVFDSAERSPSPRRSWLPLVAFYFFVGGSLLAKGLVGIVFPYAIVAFYYLLSSRVPTRKTILSFFWGTAFACIVAASWYLPMYLTHGWTFIDEFFIQHHFQRYTSNKYFHPQPFYFFFWVLPLMTLPWLPFFVGGVWRFISGRRGDTPDRNKRSLLLFASSWLLVPLVFFSFSGSKLPGYILPALPPALIFATYSASTFAVNRVRTRVLVTLAALTIVGVVAALIFAVPEFARMDSTKHLIRRADEAGFGNAKVLSMHHVSHNAEFYAAGRLLREPDGKQRKFLGPAEIREEVRREGGKTVLVIVPTEYLHQLTEASYLRTQVIDENAEAAIVAVSEDQDSAARLTRSISAPPTPVSATVSQ